MFRSERARGLSFGAAGTPSPAAITSDIRATTSCVG
jgi:hypothetical protein